MMARSGRRAARGIGLFALALLLGGCASAEPVPTSEEPSHSAETDAGSGDAGDGGADDADAAFCAATEGLGESLQAAMDASTNPAEGAESVARAKEILTEVDPPAAIAEPWAFLIRAMTLLDEAGEDPSALEDNEEAFAAVLLLPGGVEAVGVHLQEACGRELGFIAPPITDVCAVIDPATLGSVFDTVPESGSQRWGGALVECRWEAEEHAVYALAGSAAAIMDDILQRAAPVSEVALGEDTIQVHNGTIGPFRLSTRGQTAVAEIGDWAVMASVDSGDDAADELKAVALAGYLVDALP